MRLRRFEATTVGEALRRAREELGPDALILHAREAAPGEPVAGARAAVVAACDDDPAPSRFSERSCETEEREGTMPGSDARFPGRKPATWQDPWADLEEIRSLLELTAAGPRAAAGVPAAVRPLYRRLRLREVPPEAARRMALACAPRLGAHAAQVSPAGTRRALAACFQVAGASVTDQRVMIFVGPTGVGKTTTVAKLAGQLGRRWGRRIALVTLDTYRIGAVAQMRIYAELLAAPLTVAQRPAELAAAIRGLDAETVLVDTSGRSPASREGMQRLTGFLDVLPEADVHLVISATTKGSDVEATIRAFRQARYRYLVLTKLDEARTPGPVLAVAVKHGLPVSFLGTGQEVPDDLELATCHRLATLLLPDGTGRRREE